MDFKTFLPDFDAIKKTDWAKPNLKVDTKDYTGLALFAGAALMLVFVFLPWATYAYGDDSVSRLGITTWYGIFAFICAAAAVVGVLYNHTKLALCAAVLALLFGILGVAIVPDMTYEGKTFTGKEIKDAVEASKGKASLTHLGAYLYLVASVVTGAAAYLKVTKK